MSVATNLTSKVTSTEQAQRVLAIEAEINSLRSRATELKTELQALKTIMEADAANYDASDIADVDLVIAECDKVLTA